MKGRGRALSVEGTTQSSLEIVVVEESETTGRQRKKVRPPVMMGSLSERLLASSDMRHNTGPRAEPRWKPSKLEAWSLRSW